MRKEPSVFSDLGDRTVYVFFRFLAWIVNSLSGTAAARLAEAVGALLFLRKRRREFCIENLRKAFPGKTAAEVRRIGRGSMQGLIKVLFEFIRLPIISRAPGKYIRMEGKAHAWKALEKGKGLIVIVSHFGNWELAGIAGAAEGFPLHAIGKPNKNRFIDRYIKRLRGLTGLRTIDRKGAVAKCVRLLKQNQMIAMLIDEHAKEGNVEVDFFGKKVAAFSLPAVLAVRYDVPVISAFLHRREGEKFVLVLSEPFPQERTGDYEKDVVRNTQHYIRHLQDEIEKRPEDWTLWMHNRWRL